jgi:hypothetical protein
VRSAHLFRSEESVNQDCLVCLAHARAGMEALNELEEILKTVGLPQQTRTEIRTKIKLAWYTLHLRKSVCHGHHNQELEHNKNQNSAKHTLTPPLSS